MHHTEQRPWGSWSVLDEGDGYKVKRIVVEPGHRLSYQTHAERAEHWYVIRGTATCTIDGETVLARVGESVEVLVESTDGLVAEGRAEHQGPEDGGTALLLAPDLRGRVQAGALLRGRVVSSEGVDLQAVEVSVVRL